MRILRAEAENYASYKTLVTDFTKEAGLTLIQGPTGSGKSTFCDVVPWILFGKTTKGGTVDAVRSWNSKEATVGTVYLEANNRLYGIRRIRGKGNDLIYWEGEVGEFKRGKDLQDTQRLINSLLGLDYDLYLSGAYYHEFSQTAQFFITTAKNRRVICEQLVDLSLAVKLQDRIKNEQREFTKELLAAESDLRVSKSNLQLLKTKEEKEKTKALDWQKDREQRLSVCARQYELFESSRKRTVTNQCRTCGTVLAEAREVIDDRENPYGSRLVEIEAEKNPYDGEVKTYKEEIQAAQEQVKEIAERIGAIKSQVASYDSLEEVVSLYRSESINNTIKFIESNTNAMLSTFFDSEIRVEFESDAADKIEVTIQKDGNLASFTQLSKGQRQLLKLCFGVSVMQAIQNHNGISFSELFFDEATDGLDEEKKLKALKMLETLTLKSTVFLVEHSEALKNMVNNKKTVTLINGESHIG